MAGKTQSRYLSPEQAELARKQIEQGHKFREQVEQYREACERWADAQLERPQAASREAAEKGGSKPTFKTKSSRRSKRSEEHTSELQSRLHLVCRLLLEKKKKNRRNVTRIKTNTIVLLTIAHSSSNK